MATYVLPRLRCYRCYYEWTPRKARVAACPRCRSKLYATPKVRRPVRLGDGLGVEEILGPHLAKIHQLARKHGVRRIRVFGSVRRREAGPDSDVDLLVRWARRPYSVLDRSRLRLALEELLERKVDLVSEGGLPWTIGPGAEAEAIPI